MALAGKRRPLFSVVVTFYNKGAFAVDTLASVLRQTCADFEVLALDDGSTDNTKERVLSFSDPRIRYIYRENSGLPACARNTAMRLAEGEYIALLDGDDLWESAKLASCKEAIERNPQARVFCHNMGITRDGRKILRRTDYAKIAKGKLYENLLFSGNCLNPSAVVLHRDVFFAGGLAFSEEKSLFSVEDYEYWLRIAQRYRVYFIPYVLGLYRLNPKGVFFSNIDANAFNLLGLLERHFSALAPKGRGPAAKMRKRRSDVMCAAGRLHHDLADFSKSAFWYKKAIAEYPLNRKAVICLAAALLKQRIGYS